MAVPHKYRNVTMKVRWFLSASRAHSDAKSGILELQRLIDEHKPLQLSHWRVNWVGCLTLLRSAIEMFSKETRGCLPDELRKSLKDEWAAIKNAPENHRIYWDFLKRERDAIIHQYQWNAYEVWLDESGEAQNPPGLLGLWVMQDQLSFVLRMKGGPYDGRDALELIQEAEAWVGARIDNAIIRAGFDPEEERSLWSFGVVEPQPGLIAGIQAKDSQK